MITNVLTAVVTAYVATGVRCADLRWPRLHHTIAVPRRYSLKTTSVEVEGAWYVAEDRTARRFDGRFDIFVATKKEALLCGKKTIKIKVVTK